MPHPTVPEPFSHIAVRMSEKPNHIYITIDASCREEICATWGRGTSCPPFLRYISGPHFVILSDHKPLQHILERLLSCLQWPWLRYNTGHWFWKDGKQQANADLFRRLLPVLPETILFVETLDSSPSLLPRSHWGPRRTLSYPRWRTLYSVDGSIQVREHSPPAGRQQVISYKDEVLRLFICLVAGYWPWPEERKETTWLAIQDLHHYTSWPWEYPKTSWQRLHTDFAGLLQGTMFFILIDAYSKSLEVKPLIQ